MKRNRGSAGNLSDQRWISGIKAYSAKRTPHSGGEKNRPGAARCDDAGYGRYCDVPPHPGDEQHSDHHGKCQNAGYRQDRRSVNGSRRLRGKTVQSAGADGACKIPAPPLPRTESVEAARAPGSDFLKASEINKVTHQVVCYGESIKLTPIEFDILYLLASNPGRVFGTDEIFERVWHEKFYEANNTVMVHIRRLRGKMKDDTREDKIITTVWGVGYKIEA